MNRTDAQAVLMAIVTQGQARYEDSLPDYARPLDLPEPVVGQVLETAEPLPNLHLPEKRQREICLNCPLSDCVGIDRPECPIRIEQRTEWRRQNHTRRSH